MFSNSESDRSYLAHTTYELRADIDIDIGVESGESGQVICKIAQIA
jgi:hypothetical protein